MRAVVLLAVLALACVGSGPRDLDELMIRDSTYLDPSTLEPFTGEVFKLFEGGTETVQLRGALRAGTWQGELTVYHADGRVRFQGELVDGSQCGAWVENVDTKPPESL